jgi:hypothetical protein
VESKYDAYDELKESIEMHIKHRTSKRDNTYAYPRKVCMV